MSRRRSESDALDASAPAPKRRGVDEDRVMEDGIDRPEEESPEEESPEDPEPDARVRSAVAAPRTNHAASHGETAPIRRPHSRAARTNPHAPAEAGILRSIYLENFMCHRKLSVDFCPNVNFVNGDNGSGKSAILAAIQICLGASARRTGRARNLRELIRHYNSTHPPACAKVRVTLANGGSDGYKQEIYGMAITVERIISSGSGFNGYKLLDEHGREQSRSRQDLYDMLDHLNVQVENPVSVLSQEEAKTFIQGNAKDKYKFFLKATELERISSKHADAMLEITQLTDQCNKMKARLRDDHSHVEALRKKWEQHRALDKLEGKIHEFAAKMAWAKYWQFEDIYQKSMADKAKLEERAKKKLAEIKETEELASQPSEEHDQLTQRIEQLVKESQEAANLKAQLEQEFREAERPKKEWTRQLDRLRKAQMDTKKKLAAAQQRLKLKRQEVINRASESEEAKLTAELENKEAELAAAKSQLDELQETLNTSRRAFEEAQPQVEQAKDWYRNKENELHHVNKRIESLEQADADEFATLGRNVKRVYMAVSKLRQQGKFIGPVVGPVAKYLKVAVGKEKYAKVAEFALGQNALDKFIVTNDADRVLLQNIRKQCGCQHDCAIIQTHANDRFNVPPPPVEGIETVASVLNISDDLVFNALVDMYNIDQKAIALDKSTSEERLLISNPNSPLKIKGDINEVYFLPRGDHWTVRGGSLSMMSNERELISKIGIDKSAALANAQEEKVKVARELNELRNDVNRLDTQHTELTRAWSTNKKQHMVLAKKVAELTTRVDEIKMDLDCLDKGTIDTKLEEEEVTEIECELEQMRVEQANLKTQIEDVSPAIDEIKQRLEETSQRIDSILKDVNEAQDRLSTILQTQSDQQVIVERKKEKLAQYENLIAVHQKQIDQHNEERLKTLYKARILHHQWLRLCSKGDDSTMSLSQTPTEEELETIEPVRTKHTAEHYEAKIKSTKKHLEDERMRQRLNEDPEEAHQKYLQAKENYASKVLEVTKFDETTENLVDDVTKRSQLWQNFLTHLKNHTATEFDRMLRLNNYSGSLEFDDEEKKLDLIVHKGGNHNAKTKDVKGLSGGERSFTTMCLLIALGENLETPFRILDEFDVFLDPQNRNLVMSVLIHTAKQLLNRQFIFITPQDLSGVRVDNLVRIFKLNPPERIQRAGAPVQQTLPFPSATQEA